MSQPATDKRVNVQRKLFFTAVLIQIGCILVFLFDLVQELRDRSDHLYVEMLGLTALTIGAIVTFREYLRLIRRNQKVERQLDAASGAFQEVLEEYFRTWGLSAAERDVALLSIKGLSITEISQLRNTLEGTVKAQSGAIYRKAGVSNRAELISVVIEDLIAGIGYTSIPPENHTPIPMGRPSGAV